MDSYGRSQSVRKRGTINKDSMNIIVDEDKSYEDRQSNTGSAGRSDMTHVK